MKENIKIADPISPSSSRRNEEILGSGGYLGARRSIVRAEEYRRAVADGIIIPKEGRSSKSALWSLD